MELAAQSVLYVLLVAIVVYEPTHYIAMKLCQIEAIDNVAHTEPLMVLITHLVYTFVQQAVNTSITVEALVEFVLCQTGLA